MHVSSIVKRLMKEITCWSLNGNLADEDNMYPHMAIEV